VDKTVVKVVINYLSSQRGTPTTAEEVFNYLNSSGIPVTSLQDVQTILNEMHAAALIYPAAISGNEVYWYITKAGSEWKPTSRVTPEQQYTKLAEGFKGAEPATRNTYMTSWQSKLLPYYEYFQQNHPEYTNFFSWLNADPEAYKEFCKDVLALFMRMDISHKQIAYKSESYKYPETMVAVEQAMQESINRLYKHLAPQRTKFVSQQDYKGALNAIRQIGEVFPQLFYNRYVKQLPKGTFITSKVMESAIDNIVKDQLKSGATEFLQLYSEKLGLQYFLQFFIDKAQSVVDPARDLIFLPDTPNKTMAEILFNAAITNPMGGNILSTFKETAKDVGSTVLNMLFQEHVYDGVDLRSIDFSDLTISHCSFVSTNLSSTIWKNSIIRDCDFTNANFNGSDFHPKTFTGNTVTNADFEGASIAKNLPWEMNFGTPLNVRYFDAKENKEAVTGILKQPPTSTMSIPLKDSELQDATTIAKAIHQVISKMDALSSLALSLQKFGVLDIEEASQLKNWLADGKSIPTFDYGTDLQKWLVEKNRSGELAQAGFSIEDVKALFGKNSDLTPRTSPRKDRNQKNRDLQIAQFALTYNGSTSIPKEALLNLIEQKDGYLYSWIKSFNDTLTTSDLHILYAALVSSLKNHHLNSYTANPIKRFEAFPYTTYFHKVEGEGGPKSLQQYTGNYWAGKNHQFVLAIMPNYSLMPKDVAKAIHLALGEGVAHFKNAVAYSRIVPYTYTSFNAAERQTPIEKNVWYISEMQGDPIQKAYKGDFEVYKKLTGDEEPERDSKELNAEIDANFKKEEKKTDLKRNLAAYELATKVKRYFRAWPENLLNAVINAAGQAGVDEIWVPRGEMVAKKTSNLNANLSTNYDRPAKVFGGKLKNVGVSLTLDPGTSYADKDKNTVVKDTNFYVIPLAKNQVTSSLKFAPITIIKEAELNIAYWQVYVTNYIDEFIRIQKLLEPGLGTDAELAKDGFEFLLKIVPPEVSADPLFLEILDHLKKYCLDKGLGDIALSKEEEQQQNAPLCFDTQDVEDEKQGLVDKYLEQLQIALHNEDYEEASKIKKYLSELSTESSLKFSLELPRGEDYSDYEQTLELSPDQNQPIIPNKYNGSPTPSKVEDNPLKYRGMEGNDKLIFEKGLHQTMNAPMSERPITPYGSVNKQTSLKFSSDDPSFEDYSEDRGKQNNFRYDEDVPTGQDALDGHQIYDTDMMHLPFTDRQKYIDESQSWNGRENLQLGFSSLEKKSWDVSVTDVPLMSNSLVLDILQQDLYEEYQDAPGASYGDQEYGDVLNISSAQAKLLMGSSNLLREYTSYRIALRTYMGDTLYDLIGVVDKDSVVDVLEPSIIDNLSELPRLTESSLKFSVISL
jgi:uncharacterized protein YjbI with pentapeptide repeats